MNGVRGRASRGAHGRAALATAEIMAGTLLAHTVAGGGLPGVGWLLALAGLVHTASLFVVSGRAPLAPMVAGLAAAQLALHTGLAMLEPAAHHGHHAAPATLDLTWQMALAHAVSAVVTTLVWRVRRRLLDVAFGWPTPVPAAPGTAARTGVPAPRHAVTAWLVHAAPRRGPPSMPRCA